MINLGDLFEIGPHRFLCADMMTVDLPATGLFRESEIAHLTYTDPPWTVGIAKVFRQWTGEVKPEVNLKELLYRALLTIQRYSAGHIFIEMGKQNLPMIQGMAEAMGAVTFQVYTTTYTHPPKPMKVWHGSWRTLDPKFPQDSTLEGRHSWDGGRWIVENYGQVGAILFDPFMGLGGMAKMALHANMVIRGMELNPNRLQRTLNTVSQRTGHPIWKVVSA